MDGVTFSNEWVSPLPSIYIRYDITNIYVWVTDFVIHIQIEWTTVVLILSDIFVLV
jgi:hypothetical protein